MNTTTFGLLVAVTAMLPGSAAGQAPTPPAPAATLPRVSPPPKPRHSQLTPGCEPKLISIKFRDGLQIRLRDGALTDFGTGALAKAAPLLATLHAAIWSRGHTVAEAELDRLRELGERNVGYPLHDLNLVFRCALPAEVDTEATLDAWNALDVVERAEPVPIPVAPPQAPDYRYRQTGSEPPPRGIGAGTFQQMPDPAGTSRWAATGGHARICDIEFGYDQAHADLPGIAPLTSPGATLPAYDEHGTAVLGMLGARNDGVGVTGNAWSAQLYFAHATSPTNTYVVDQAIPIAQGAVGQGGIVLLEVQIGGPRWNGSSNQFGMLPVEWHYATWLAIHNAVAAGTVVVEAAGNGQQDLDDPFYGGWFSSQYDSGALMVGAGAAPGGNGTARSRLQFSNFGETVDLQGHGERVVTTGYGDLFAAGGPAQYYTQTFSGTSSASPMVAGACALLQSRHQELRQFSLMPWELRAVLRRSGTPQQAGTFPTSQNIGPLPDVMRAAIELRVDCGRNAALGFDESLPFNGGNGLEMVNGSETITAMASFDDDGPGPNGTRLYAAGNFSRAGNRPANNIACWNGVGWQELGSGLGYANGAMPTIAALQVFDADGAGAQLPQLYAVGNFDRAGGVACSGLARWNGIGWSAVPGFAPSPGAMLLALTTIDEDGPGPLAPALIVGGSFTSIGGLPANRIARWRSGVWSTLGAGFDDTVHALEVWDADDIGPGLPRLVAGGYFQNSGATQTRKLAIWNGGFWTEFAGGTGWYGDVILALRAIPVPLANQQYLVVGGSFWQIGGGSVATQGLAVFTGGGWFYPTSPAVVPTTIVAFDDGTDPMVPRQQDAILLTFGGPFQLDLRSWMTSSLPVSSWVTSACALVFDEDGDGVQPPALLLGGTRFNTPAGTTGLARLFGQKPAAPPANTVILPTRCGNAFAPTIAVAGDPVLGAPFTVQFDCLPLTMPLLCIGVPQVAPIPLCGGAPCQFGVQPLAYAYGQRSLTYTFPNDPAFTGVYFAFQGFELLARPFEQRCAPPYFPIDLRASDTLVLTF